MFTQLYAQNFKSWRELPTVDLKPITGVFGANSSGKTSLLQLLLLMKQTAESPDRQQPLQFGDDRSHIDLGSFRDVVTGHDPTAALTIGFSWRPHRTLQVTDPATPGETLFTAADLAFETTIRANARGATWVEGFEYHADENSVRMARSSTRQGRRDPEYQLLATINGRQDYLRRSGGRPWPLPAPVKSYGFPDEAIAYFQNSGFVSDLELALDRQFTDNVFYLGPLRGYPSRQYQWQGTRPQGVGAAGERAIEVLLASREEGRRNARAFDARGHARKRITVEEHVAEWLKQLGLISSFTLERLSEHANFYRVLVQKTQQSTPVALTDVGFGVSQILPVLVLLAWVPEGSTVILEQPEIHLHPAVQSGLADIIAETATVRGVQVIVESHSEHLLRRLQLRVAEETVDHTDIALYFCDSKTDGSSKISDLRLNVFGEIDNWPPDFFGDPLGETAAITRAALLRRISQQAG